MNQGRMEGARVAIYARYSTDKQNPRSIDGQIQTCRAHARTLGGVVTGTYADPARTGTTMRNRPALRDMLSAACDRRFDVVCAEALDRISRDQEDICYVYKRLRFADVRLVTLEDGEIDPMHVGIRGLMAEAYVRNLAEKVRRGLQGVVREGRVPGRLCYGYKVANRIDSRGQIVRGLREIDPVQAGTVRRIFALYAGGLGATTIAHILNGEGIPAPRGNMWTSKTIYGHAKRRSGILHNDIYRGKFVFGIQRKVRNPDTGKQTTRIVPGSQPSVHDVPHLRIVDDELWAAVQARYYSRRPSSTVTFPRGPAKPLTPLVRCARCDGKMLASGRRRYKCQTRRHRHTCDMKRGIDVRDLECRAAAALCDWTRTQTDWAAVLENAVRERACQRARLADSVSEGKRRLECLLETVENGGGTRSLLRRIAECEQTIAADRLELDGLDALPMEPPAQLPNRLRTRLRDLRQTVGNCNGHERDAALYRLRDLLDSIRIEEGPGRWDTVVTIQPRRDALIAFALQDAGGHQDSG